MSGAAPRLGGMSEHHADDGLPAPVFQGLFEIREGHGLNLALCLDLQDRANLAGEIDVEA